MCGQQQATSPTPSTTMNNQSGSTQMVESNLLLATTMAQNSGVGYQNNHSGNQNPHLSGQMTNQSMGFNNKTIPPFPCTYRLGSSLSNIGMGELGLSTGSTMQDQVSSVGSGCRSVGKIEPEDPVSKAIRNSVDSSQLDNSCEYLQKGKISWQILEKNLLLK